MDNIRWPKLCKGRMPNMLVFASIVLIASLWSTPVSFAQSQTGETKPKAQVGANPGSDREAARQKRLKAIAESYTMFVGEEGKIEAKLQEEPIFRWGNPVRATIGGAIFLWTHQGRPHATIGLWTYDDTSATDSYELQSLSETPFASQGPLEWSPKVAGVSFKKLAGKPNPGSSRSIRLIQMRTLARKHFSAKLMPNRGPVEDLRLLPAPVYRYEEKPEDVIDGAIFSLASGTDPEVLLILEARNVGDERSWFYAFANQTSATTSAYLNRKKVWENEGAKSAFLLEYNRPQR